MDGSRRSHGGPRRAGRRSLRRDSRFEGPVIDDLEALVLVERAKREAAELIERYERELFLARRFAEFIQLGIVRYLLTAPVDFLQRVDALRAACPEMDRVQAREVLHTRLDEWRRHVEAVDRRVAEGNEGAEAPGGQP